MSEPIKTSRNRGLKIALALSLAANVAVVGLVVGVVAGGEGRSNGPPRLHTFGLAPFALAFEREDRAALRAALGDDRLLADRRQLGGALREVQAALRAEPFDRAAAEAALARSRGLVDGLQAAGHAALLDHLTQMSAEARAEFADNLERVLRRAPGRNRDR